MINLKKYISMKSNVVAVFCFFLILITSCKKDYSCTCETTYDTGYKDTLVYQYTHISTHEATDLCNLKNGPFSYNDPVTGYPVSGTKSCTLE